MPPGPARRAEACQRQVEATRAAGYAGLSLWRLHAEAAVESLGSAEAVREMVPAKEESNLEAVREGYDKLRIFEPES